MQKTFRVLDEEEVPKKPSITIDTKKVAWIVAVLVVIIALLLTGTMAWATWELVAESAFLAPDLNWFQVNLTIWTLYFVYQMFLGRVKSKESPK